MRIIGDADAFDACMGDGLAVEFFLGHLALLFMFWMCGSLRSAPPLCLSG
jgi:hypothetical protein